jgi:hypothetical protein
MGLIITNNINTDSGSTSESYINISKFEVTKDGDTQVFLNLYLNKIARDANSLDTVTSRAVIRRFGISQVDLDVSNIYVSLYAKLKTKLEDAGLTVIDEI